MTDNDSPIDQPEARPATSAGDGRSSTGPTPGVAAILSFAVPGLGQIASGAIRRGLLIALPTLLLVAVVVAVLAGGTRSLLATLVQPTTLLALVIANGLFAVYHLFAIGDAFRQARRRGPRPASPARSWSLLALALAATIGLHGLVGEIGLQAYSTVSTILVPPSTGYTIPVPSFGPATPTPTNGFVDEPTPTPGPAWAADGRLNLLLIGADAGPGRYLLRTDTMIVLSVDVATGRAALFGLPRNLVGAPLPPESAAAFPDGRFPDLLNAVYVYAITHPAQFPGGDARGFRAISGTIQQLVGVPLDGAVVVNLNGFVDLVNAIGGLWIDVKQPVYDTKYPLENGLADVTINIHTGCQHFSGHLALAFARSRHQDSDYGRMQRQQTVLLALLRQVDPIGLLPKVPQLLDIAKDNMILTIPAADIGSLAALASTIDPATVKRIEFSPPTYPEYLTTKEIARMQTVVRTVFDAPTTIPGASQSPSLFPSLAPSSTSRPGPTPESCPPA